VLEVRAKNPNDSIMVFTKTCKTAELLERAFRKLGLVPSALHSMKPQKERLGALALFKSNQTKLLIATDVASRGLDIPEVELVINHNVPTAPRVRINSKCPFSMCVFASQQRIDSDPDPTLKLGQVINL
jgi:superfamily II DNA/RNA helicase